MPVLYTNVIFIFFSKALDEQEETLKQQIVHIERQVKESIPDKARLKQLEDLVKSHEKGKKYIDFKICWPGWITLQLG